MNKDICVIEKWLKSWLDYGRSNKNNFILPKELEQFVKPNSINLYRGFSEDYKIEKSIRINGLSSFTTDLNIAADFTTMDGKFYKYILKTDKPINVIEIKDIYFYLLNKCDLSKYQQLIIDEKEFINIDKVELTINNIRSEQLLTHKLSYIESR